VLISGILTGQMNGFTQINSRYKENTRFWLFIK